jgi:outer membrane protein assembly factor BamA
MSVCGIFFVFYRIPFQVLGLRSRLGVLLPFGGGDMHAADRFFLGGVQDSLVKGFVDSAVGPEEDGMRVVCVACFFAGQCSPWCVCVCVCVCVYVFVCLFVCSFSFLMEILIVVGHHVGGNAHWAANASVTFPLPSPIPAGFRGQLLAGAANVAMLHPRM